MTSLHQNLQEYISHSTFLSIIQTITLKIEKIDVLVSTGSKVNHQKTKEEIKKIIRNQQMPLLGSLKKASFQELQVKQQIEEKGNNFLIFLNSRTYLREQPNTHMPITNGTYTFHSAIQTITMKKKA